MRKPKSLGLLDSRYAPDISINNTDSIAYWHNVCVPMIQEGARILCLGDSVVEGYTLSNYMSDSWPSVLRRLLHKRLVSSADDDPGMFWASSDGFGSNGSLWTLSTGNFAWTQYDASTTNSGAGLRTIVPAPSGAGNRSTATLTLDGSAVDAIRTGRRITGFEVVAAQTSDSGNLYIDVFTGAAGGTVGAGDLYSGILSLTNATTVLGKRWGPIIPAGLAAASIAGSITIQIASNTVGNTTKFLFDGIVTYTRNETASISQPSIQVINLGNGGTQTSHWNPSGGTASLIMAAQLQNWNDNVARQNGPSTRKVNAVIYGPIGYNNVATLTGTQTMSAGAATTVISDIVATATLAANIPSSPLVILVIGMQPKSMWCGTNAWNQMAGCITQAYNQLRGTFGSQIMLVDARAWNAYKAGDDATSLSYKYNWLLDSVHPVARYHYMFAERIAKLLT